jgi:aspartate/methionine/tyrosine aminotransferase
VNPLFTGQPTSIFAHMSALALEHGAVNLGQGFPDFGWPEDVVARAAEALTTGSNQYAPMMGLPELRQAVAGHYRHHQGLGIDASHVMITSGATEALASSILAMIEPGDEVLLFQPLYDAYVPLVRRAGGIPRFVRLEPPGWRITRDAFAEAVTERTRLLIFNNPHNPTARAFDEEELRLVAELCRTHDLVALSDEVWEHVVFGDRHHIPLSSLPGMAERTVKVGSAGKIFSLTGWKVGWLIAPPELGVPISKAHQYLTYATPPNLQAAVAYGLAKQDGYFERMRSSLESARNSMATALRDSGFATLPAEGTYFLSVDLAASGIRTDDVTFCERAVREAGVAAIPLSPFFEEAPVDNVVRLCFAKRPETIAEGVDRLVRAKMLF